MIIDFHTHVFPPKVGENRADYIKRDACFAELYSSPKAKLITADELVATMDEQGIDVSVILNIGWVSNKLCQETNDYILESIARYPRRLVGFCTIQPQAGEAAIAEIERCARNGIKGIGEIRPDIQGFDLADQTVMGPIADAAARRQLLVLTHASEPVGHQYSGKGVVTPDVLYQFISSFPQLRIICAHWGGGLPFYTLMPEVASALSNTFFDTAASPFLYRPQIFEQVMQLVGADKILFGSDYPLIAPKRIISEIKSLGLPAETENMLLGGNAQRLLGLLDN
jgi:hypothetical protein